MCTAHLEGPHREVEVGYRQRERQDPGHMPLFGSMNGMVWGSQAKVRLVNSNQKEPGFGKLHGGLMGHTKREGPGRWGDCLSQGWEGHVRNLHLLVTLRLLLSLHVHAW